MPQTSPELTGTETGKIAKLVEENQRLSSKLNRLPLHHSPRFLNTIRGLIGILRVLASDWIDSAPSVRRSTRSLPALASARRWACCDRGAAKPRLFPGTGCAPVSGRLAHERVFRRAGFSPHGDGRAQPAPPKASRHRRRHLRNQTRRRIFDVEPVHDSRDRAG